MMYPGYGMGVGGWLVMTLIVVVGVGLVTAVTVAVVRSLWPADRETFGRFTADGPERVLADRFARGEIGVEEYEARLRTLRVANS
jgi:putative membrane protein